MACVTSGLPSRFPVGTKFVIEGRPGGKGRVFSRYLEFPDGTRISLPKRAAKSESAQQPIRRRPRRARTRRL
jgi:hypothetical protein